MRILLVEDDISLSNAIKKILEQSGSVVDAVYDGQEALDYISAAGYDLIVLDVMLPKYSGFEVVRKVRESGTETPVLMLTARSATADKVSGLNSGADDYMTKPFEPEELIARVNALTRRLGKVVLSTLEYEDLSLNINSGVLACKDKQIQLTGKELKVMQIFMSYPAMTVTADDLITRIWGADSEATNNNAEVYISFIRKKLSYLGSSVYIKNIPRIGYRLEARHDK